MNLTFTFFFNSILLGIGLAMDAFSVSMANGLNEPCMKHRKMCGIAGMFGFFQALMPMLGWFLVHNLVMYFHAVEPFIPWTALALLGFIGGKMLYEGITDKGECGDKPGVGFFALVVQGIATSIDALSVGLTISEYNFTEALLASLIIAAVTFVICMAGLVIGRTAGSKLSGKAGILGGVILIFIGIEILVKSFF
ncbi:MAG: manganese efflux pump [Clostridia bacterium]|nr:manganese efflux pump [Clostridia bacterium]